MRDIFRDIFNPARARRRRAQRDASRRHDAAAPRGADTPGFSNVDARAEVRPGLRRPAARPAAAPAAPQPSEAGLGPNGRQGRDRPPLQPMAQMALAVLVGNLLEGLDTPDDAQAFFAGLSTGMRLFDPPPYAPMPETNPSVSFFAGMGPDGPEVLLVRRIASDPRAVERAIEASEAAEEARFQGDFTAAHGGTVAAMRSLLESLLRRDAASVPPGGITRESIESRDWDITYKLPALLLARQLPALCAGNGALRDVALFDARWQKPAAEGSATYPSMLPRIFEHLRSMHDGDLGTLQAALPALVARLSQRLECGAAATESEASDAEKALDAMVREAAHHIDGHVLYETLGKAYAGLPAS